MRCDSSIDGRASAIAYASFRQWRALGLGEALAANAQAIRQILVTDGQPVEYGEPLVVLE